MDLAPQIIELLASGDGLKASYIAKQLGVDRKRINAILYGPLKGQVRQDKSYKWYFANDIGIACEKTSDAPAPKTVLSQICRYYLECLSFDTDQKVSAFADGQFDLDYAEIDQLPFDGDSSKSLFSSPEASSLRGHKRGHKRVNPQEVRTLNLHRSTPRREALENKLKSQWKVQHDPESSLQTQENR